MLIKKANRRYAKALLDFARETNTVEPVYQDVELIREYLKASDDLRVVLKSPVIMPKRKEGVVDKVFDGRIGETTMNFLKIVIRRGREGSLEETMFSFVEQYRQLKGIEEAIITTATQITEDQRTQIHAKLTEITGNEIVMVERVDADIIGGIRIKLGDRQYEATVARKLEELRRSFEENIFVPEL